MSTPPISPHTQEILQAAQESDYSSLYPAERAAYTLFARISLATSLHHEAVSQFFRGNFRWGARAWTESIGMFFKGPVLKLKEEEEILFQDLHSSPSPQRENSSTQLHELSPEEAHDLLLKASREAAALQRPVKWKKDSREIRKALAAAQKAVSVSHSLVSPMGRNTFLSMKLDFAESWIYSIPSVHTTYSSLLLAPRFLTDHLPIQMNDGTVLKFALFALIDPTLGCVAADYVKTHLSTSLQENISKKWNSVSKQKDSFDFAMYNGIGATCSQLHAQFPEYAKAFPSNTNSSLPLQEHLATMTLILIEPVRKVMWVANLGNSRAIIHGKRSDEAHSEWTDHLSAASPPLHLIRTEEIPHARGIGGPKGAKISQEPLFQKISLLDLEAGVLLIGSQDLFNYQSADAVKEFFKETVSAISSEDVVSNLKTINTRFAATSSRYPRPVSCMTLYLRPSDWPAPAGYDAELESIIKQSEDDLEEADQLLPKTPLSPSAASLASSEEEEADLSTLSIKDPAQLDDKDTANCSEPSGGVTQSPGSPALEDSYYLIEHGDELSEKEMTDWVAVPPNKKTPPPTHCGDWTGVSPPGSDYSIVDEDSTE